MSSHGFGPAAGTNQGPDPRPVMIKFPPRVTLTDAELHIIGNVLREFAAGGLYMMLATHCTFDTGEVLTTYAHLLTIGGMPPQPERGRRRKTVTYEQLRRILRDLEAAGLVRREPTNNAAQGQLRLWLPHRAALADQWKKTLAQRNKTQGLAQGQKARKAA